MFFTVSKYLPLPRLGAVIACVSVLTLSACVSAPVAKRPIPAKPVNRVAVVPAPTAAVVHSLPAQQNAASVSTPTAAAPNIVTTAPVKTAITERITQTIRPDNDPALNTSVIISTRTISSKNESNKSASQDLVARLRRGFAMPTRYHPRINSQFTRYAGQQKYVDELMAKASRFMFIAVAEAERRGLPTELALLPIIESAYDPSATSKSNAAGLWQFIPDTGRLYGLRQTNWFDARRDPLESTRAAYDYLAKLYGIFGDWELVLASYNAGPGTVSRAIKANDVRGRGSDYWSLDLPAEAMDYVPRFLAVVALFKDPITAGVTIPALPNRPYFRTVAAQGTLDLDTVAALSGISLDELRTLNPGLRRDQLAPGGPYLLHVPNYLDVASEYLLVQQSVPSDVRVVNTQGQPEAVVALPNAQVIRASFIDANSHRYSVRRGDSWYSIARANQLSPKQLAQANDDQLSTILDVGRELNVPTPAAAAYQAHVFSPNPTAKATATRDPVAPASNDTATQIIQAGNRGL